MQALILLVLVVLVTLVSSTPINPTQRLINRPHRDVNRRSTPNVKGHFAGIKGRKPMMPALKKGEYVCGNRICKLEPGVIPKNCNGDCQYPVH